MFIKGDYMNILLTNDDGINSIGLIKLKEIAKVTKNENIKPI